MAAYASWWHETSLLRWPLLYTYVVLMCAIATYGLHRYWLVFLYLKNGRSCPQPQGQFDELPAVTVQLPMYNEAQVAERVIDAACQLDYPPEKLQVQVLDDSTADCVAIARRRCEYWAGRGVNIQHCHRTQRSGYKAGAMRDAMPTATGQFIAVFDADFVPPADFLKRTIHYFTDHQVGMVQTRWDHLNRTNSLLTRCQALFLDGHFIIEHAARNRSNCWINFNGTAGMWRRRTIESAGGWQDDTLTEDLDLSYRSQLAGWRFVYVPDIVCPAQLPLEMNAFKSQQHRWTKGSIQTAIKILPRLFRTNMPLRVKIEAFFHLTCPMVYLYMTLMALLLYPTLYFNIRPLEVNQISQMLLALGCIVVGVVSVSLFYLVSQVNRRQSLLGTMIQIPMLMSLGVGIAINNARACVEALVGHQSPFVRTPKYNLVAVRPRTNFIPIASVKLWVALLELTMGAYMLVCIWIAKQINHGLLCIPFLLIFAIGYLYVGVNSLRVQLQPRKPTSIAASNSG